EGVNSRLDDLQAEILLRKVERLDAWNERRRELAAFYLERLADAGVVLPVEAEGTKHSWHLFVVLVEERDAFRARLRERGVETLVHYPEPIHRQPAYGHLPRVEVPVAERLCERVVSLPLYPELTDAEAEQVVEAVPEAGGSGGASQRDRPQACPRRNGSTCPRAGPILRAAGRPRPSRTRTRGSGRATSLRSRRRSRSASTTRRPRC